MNVSFLKQDLNSWIPYVNIALIFFVISIYGLGPCESFCRLIPAENIFNVF